MRAVTSTAILAGPPLAGIAIAAAGVAPAFAANALSFLVSAVLVSRIPGARLQRARRSERPRLRAGLALYASPALRALLSSWTLVQITWVVVNIGEILLARSVFHTGSGGYGLLVGCSGAGLLAGSLASGRVANRVPVARAYRGSLILAGAGFAVAALAHSFPAALLCIAIGSAGNAASSSYAALIVQQSIDDDHRGQAFGVFSSCSSLAAVVGMAACGPIEAGLGVRVAWLVGAGVALGAACVSWLVAREHVLTAGAAAASD